MTLENQLDQKSSISVAGYSLEGQKAGLVFIHCFPKPCLFTKNLNIPTCSSTPTDTHTHKWSYSEFPPKSEHKWSFSFVKVPKPEGSGRGLKGTKLDLHLNGMNLRIHCRALNGTATFYPCLFLPLWQKCYFSPTGSINKRTVCLPKNPHLQLARFHLSLRLATL